MHNFFCLPRGILGTQRRKAATFGYPEVLSCLLALLIPLIPPAAAASGSRRRARRRQARGILCLCALAVLGTLWAAGLPGRRLPEAAAAAPVQAASAVPSPAGDEETRRAAILAEAKREIAALAVAITERMLRQDLDNREAQTQLASRLMEEFDPKNRKTWTPD